MCSTNSNGFWSNLFIKAIEELAAEGAQLHFHQLQVKEKKRFVKQLLSLNIKKKKNTEECTLSHNK